MVRLFVLFRFEATVLFVNKENQKNFLRCLTHLLSLADDLSFDDLFCKNRGLSFVFA